MKYHYHKGMSKSNAEKAKQVFWNAVIIFAALIIYDILFNNCNLFINLLLWTWGER